MWCTHNYNNYVPEGGLPSVPMTKALSHSAYQWAVYSILNLADKWVTESRIGSVN